MPLAPESLITGPRKLEWVLPAIVLPANYYLLINKLVAFLARKVVFTHLLYKVPLIDSAVNRT
jgi:hypothetical protein